MRSTPPALVTLLALVSLCAAPYCFAQPQQSSFDVKALDEKDRAKISLLKKVESVKKRVAPTTEQLLELLQECPEPEMR
jgi:hypothetical protein